MALYVVERDVNQIPPEQLRRNQRDVALACIDLKTHGKRIRYISSGVVPADGLAVDLFGADTSDLVEEVQAAAGIRFSRIVEILDLTPSFIDRQKSRPSQSLHRTVGTYTDSDKAEGVTHIMTTDSASELKRWLSDGQRFFAMCMESVENVEHLQNRNTTLEGENELLREEVARLRQKVDVLQTERADMVAAFNDLAGHVTQVVDHILQRSEENDSTA